MFKEMSDEKLKRTVSGFIVGGTILILILLAVLVYQLIAMAVTSAKISAAQKQEEEYLQLIDDLKSDYDYYGSDYAKYIAAMEHGYGK